MKDTLSLHELAIEAQEEISEINAVLGWGSIKKLR